MSTQMRTILFWCGLALLTIGLIWLAVNCIGLESQAMRGVPTSSRDLLYGLVNLSVIGLGALATIAPLLGQPQLGTAASYFEKALREIQAQKSPTAQTAASPLPPPIPRGTAIEAIEAVAGFANDYSHLIPELIKVLASIQYGHLPDSGVIKLAWGDAVLPFAWGDQSKFK